MIPQLISTDDIITELDSNFENLSTMSSPVLGNFSPISTSCKDGEDYSALSDPEVEFLDNYDRGEVVEPLPPLQSFVIKMLPGLHLKDNSYYANTRLIRGDLKTFKSYARRVEELVLTDVDCDKYPRVSQDVITRLALIQDVNNPFLSSLKRLRLVDVDSELSYMWLCITPSLETLGISRIPPTCQNTIDAFLAELVDSAPRLGHITLGPGQLSPSALWTSVRFVHLRELRIDVCELRNDDAVAALDFAFLQAVAALPALTLFDIDARTGEYTPYIPPADTITADERDAAISAAEPRGGAPAPFPCLKTLTAAGTVLLMHDLLHCLLPHGVEHVSMTLIRPGILPIPAHWDPMLPVF